MTFPGRLLVGLGRPTNIFWPDSPVFSTFWKNLFPTCPVLWLAADVRVGRTLKRLPHPSKTHQFMLAYKE
jgi:hypothetical protein